MRNSLTKPFSGGRPQMATAPTRKARAVITVANEATVVSIAEYLYRRVWTSKQPKLNFAMECWN